MRPTLRLVLGLMVIGLWAIWVQPRLSHQLLQARARRSTTISIPTLTMAWADLDQRGETLSISAEERARIERESAAISEISLLEEQLISAIWAQIPDPSKPAALSAARANTEPPPLFDPRYVDPFGPALIQAVIESYGYRRLSAPLPDVRASMSIRSRPERMTATRWLVERGDLTPDAAARVLDAALRLTTTQRDRVARERKLSAQLPQGLRDLAARMHGEGRHLEK
jgi:hypothetical protein